MSEWDDTVLVPWWTVQARIAFAFFCGLVVGGWVL